MFRTDDTTVTAFADAPLRPGRRYAYSVQGLTAAGRVVASSRTVYVDVPDFETPSVEALRLQCAATDTDAGERGRVRCAWSRPTEVAPRAITLWRSVDGAARERVASFAAPFATSYRDVVPSGTSRVVYAVIGTDGDGEIVARSRPDAVTFRSTGTPPRPTDVEVSEVADVADVVTLTPTPTPTLTPPSPPPPPTPRPPRTSSRILPIHR